MFCVVCQEYRYSRRNQCSAYVVVSSLFSGARTATRGRGPGRLTEDGGDILMLKFLLLLCADAQTFGAKKTYNPL